MVPTAGAASALHAGGQNGAIVLDHLVTGQQGDDPRHQGASSWVEATKAIQSGRGPARPAEQDKVLQDGQPRTIFNHARSS